MSRYRFGWAVVFGVSVSLSAAAATWTGGSGDGKWSTKGNWKGELLPANGEACTISKDYAGDIVLTEDVRIGSLEFAENTDTPNIVRLTGGFTLSLTGRMTINDGRTFVLDGARMDATQNSAYCFNIKSSAVFEVRSGEFNGNDCTTASYHYGRILITDGRFYVYRMKFMNADSCVIQTGGYGQCDRFDIGDGASADWRNLGGTYVMPTAVALSKTANLPAGADATLIVRSTSDVTAMNAAGDYRLGGTLYVTNGYENGSRQQVKITAEGTTVAGRGTFFANKLYTGASGSPTLHLDLARLSVADYDAYNSGSKLVTHNGLTLGVYATDFTDDQLWTFNGPLTLDTTDCFDPASSRNYAFTKYLSPGLAPGLCVKGDGTVVWEFETSAPYTDVLYSKIGADGAGSLTLRDGGKGLSLDFGANAVTLGAGATLEMNGGNTRIQSMTRAAEIGAGATLKVTVNGTLKEGNRHTVFDAGPWGSVAGLTIDAESVVPDGWRLAKSENAVYLTDDTTFEAPMDDTKTPYYFLAKDGSWRNVKNWNITKSNPDQQKTPPVNSTVYFVGCPGMAITNDTGATVSIARMEFREKCGPIVFRGDHGFKLSAVRVEDSTSALLGNGANRTSVTFECPVNSPKEAFYACPVQGYFALLGGLSIPDGCFYFSGDNRLGGTSALKELSPSKKATRYDGTAGTAELTLVTGAVVTVSGQATNWVQSSLWRIGTQAALRFTGGELVVRESLRALVEGEFDIGVPFTVATGEEVSFVGTGCVTVASTAVSPEASGKVCLAEGVRLDLGGWDTVSAGAADKTMTIKTSSAVTIGATADWTYGPAADVTPTTAAADRALVTEGLYAPLTIDTQDPETGDGHTVTFADPLVARGDVIKTGAGTLVLASDGNEFSHRLDVRGGAVRCAVSQTMPELLLSQGTSLTCDADAVLTADSDVDVTDVTFGEPTVTGEYVTVLKVTDGHVITGVPSAVQGLKTRVWPLPEGGQQLQVCKRGGLLLLVY